MPPLDARAETSEMQLTQWRQGPPHLECLASGSDDAEAPKASQ